MNSLKWDLIEEYRFSRQEYDILLPHLFLSNTKNQIIASKSDTLKRSDSV